MTLSGDFYTVRFRTLADVNKTRLLGKKEYE